MSKLAPNGTSAARGQAKAPEDGELHHQLSHLRLHSRADTDVSTVEEEVCRVCRSSRYLNPNMKFLISKVCYHKMCESCVDRKFQSPGPCPYVECKRTLRKSDFRRQTFADIGVEREVDIRRDMAET